MIFLAEVCPKRFNWRFHQFWKQYILFSKTWSLILDRVWQRFNPLVLATVHCCFYAGVIKKSLLNQALFEPFRPDLCDFLGSKKWISNWLRFLLWYIRRNYGKYPSFGLVIERDLNTVTIWSFWTPYSTKQKSAYYISIMHLHYTTHFWL